MYQMTFCESVPREVVADLVKLMKEHGVCLSKVEEIEGRLSSHGSFDIYVVSAESWGRMPYLGVKESNCSRH